MMVRKYQRRIWKNKIKVLILILLVIIGCSTQNSENPISNNREHEKITDFSTSSNFITVKVKKNVIDTMTIVLPSEILQRYIRGEYSSDSSYINAIIWSARNYLKIPSNVYDAFQTYRVNFKDGFIASWATQKREQIIDSFFEKGNGGLFYACIGETIVENQVVYLLISKNMNPYKDDETGCTILNSKVDTIR